MEVDPVVIDGGATEGAGFDESTLLEIRRSLWRWTTEAGLKRSSNFLSLFFFLKKIIYFIYCVSVWTLDMLINAPEKH